MASFIMVTDDISVPIANFSEKDFCYIHDWMLNEVYLRRPVQDDLEAKNVSSAYLDLKTVDLEKLRNCVEEENLEPFESEYCYWNNVEEWLEENKEYTLNSIDRAIEAIEKGYSIEYRSNYRF